MVINIEKKLIDTATKTGIDAAETDSTEVSRDLIGNKIADKMKEKKAKKIKEIYIAPEETQKIIEDINHSWLGEHNVPHFPVGFLTGVI